jgi:hypothetical protein
MIRKLSSLDDLPIVLTTLTGRYCEYLVDIAGDEICLPMRGADGSVLVMTHASCGELPHSHHIRTEMDSQSLICWCDKSTDFVFWEIEQHGPQIWNGERQLHGISRWPLTVGWFAHYGAFCIPSHWWVDDNEKSRVTFSISPRTVSWTFQLYFGKRRHS